LALPVALSGALTILLRAIMLIFDPGVGNEKVVAVFTAALGFHGFPPSENMKTTIFQKITENALKTNKIYYKFYL
jgi:hypothetical protein